MKDLNPKLSRLATLIAAGLLNFSGASGLRAADGSAPTPPNPDREREELREKMKEMTPAERRAAVLQWRAQHPESAANARELQNRPAEPKTITPEERAAKMKERRAAAEARLTELRKKKTDGTITTEESQQLDRMEAFLKARSSHPKPQVGDQDLSRKSGTPPTLPRLDSGK